MPKMLDRIERPLLIFSTIMVHHMKADLLKMLVGVSIFRAI